jgi:hypothetical protein
MNRPKKIAVIGAGMIDVATATELGVIEHRRDHHEPSAVDTIAAQI